jgi:hypothetical protein
MEQQLCRGCGCALPTTRPLKHFCKYACRGLLRVREATNHRTGLIGSKNTKQRKALQDVKRQSLSGYSFSKTNSCSIRLDRPNKRGAGWLMELAWPGGSRQRWAARIGDRASEPLPLEEAKRAAVSMLRERGKADPRDFIAELDQIAANEVDRAVLQRERRKWPLNIMGGGAGARPCMTIEPGLREIILEVES